MADQHCMQVACAGLVISLPASAGRLPHHYHIHCAVPGSMSNDMCRYFAVGWQWFGYWLAFFSVQGPLCLAEAWLSRQGVRLPRPVAVVATTAVLLLCANRFFFPPAVDTGLADKVQPSVA